MAVSEKVPVLALAAITTLLESVTEAVPEIVCETGLMVTPAG